MARAFPSCSMEGTTSFSRRWLSVFGSYRPSQVRLPLDLHTVVADYLVPAVPTIESERNACRLLTPDILHGEPREYGSYRSLARFRIQLCGLALVFSPFIQTSTLSLKLLYPVFMSLQQVEFPPPPSVSSDRFSDICTSQADIIPLLDLY
ncbi:hypothetical protein EDC04DRAFT_2972811 [Pisolithus marmoratus]|nr:hypothetical protein EDC04DRAFT_2972811 [Pisolithus marmoratus]